MSAAHAYTRSIAKISSESMQEYLLDRGWKRKPYSNEGMLVFEGPMKDDYGEPIIQVFPRSEQSPDYVMRVRELVNALSVIEDRTVEDILRDIRHEIAPETITPASTRPKGWTFSPRLLGLAATGLFILVIASLAGNALLWKRAEAASQHAEAASQHAEAASQHAGDCAKVIAEAGRRVDERMSEIELRAARSNRTIAKAFALSLVDSIKHGDEWLKLKAIDSLAELAETDQIRDMAEPVLVWATGDDKGSTPKVREAAAKALNRIRSPH